MSRFHLLLACQVVVSACRSSDDSSRAAPALERSNGGELFPVEASSPSSGARDGTMAARRAALVEELRAEGIQDPQVLRAIGDVPRHELVPAPLREVAYRDRPLPIGEDQTMSQPSVVALMTQLARVDPGDKVLEVGTGSGYQAAVLAEITDEVHTIEIVPSLAERAREDLERLGYADEIAFRVGDGYAGWPEAAPFDAILVTAAPPEVPEPLKAQLAMGGRMVVPVGEGLRQELRVLERTPDGIVERDVLPVRFVPMTGEAQEQP